MLLAPAIMTTGSEPRVSAIDGRNDTSPNGRCSACSRALWMGCPTSVRYEQGRRATVRLEPAIVHAPFAGAIRCSMKSRTR